MAVKEMPKLAIEMGNLMVQLETGLHRVKELLEKGDVDSVLDALATKVQGFGFIAKFFPSAKLTAYVDEVLGDVIAGTGFRLRKWGDYVVNDRNEFDGSIQVRLDFPGLDSVDFGYLDILPRLFVTREEHIERLIVDALEVQRKLEEESEEWMRLEGEVFLLNKSLKSYPIIIHALSTYGFENISKLPY